MDWGFLYFLAEPWFVILWYGVGILGAALVIYDLHKHNTPLKKAMKWAWPIIVLFFSILGIALYYGTARAPGIADKKDPEEKKKAHEAYEKNMARRVNGAVIHCVAGDGLGIMTGMVIARATGMSFWQEFWFEYLVGFLFGWFIFQFKSMMMMTDSKGMALAMAFRAEFFSMLTVMAGMGAVMGYITPLTATQQPKPLTYAFWGFGMFGLLVGYVFTFPMNWLMVKAGWKHGMGGMGGEHQVKERGPRMALITAMVVLGFGALIVPAWLAESRDGRTLAQVESYAGAVGSNPASGLKALEQGIRIDLSSALMDLDEGRRSEAMHAIDAAMRAADVGKGAAPGSVFKDRLDGIKAARHEIHMGNLDAAKKRLSAIARAPAAARIGEKPGSPEPNRFQGATVINANGIKIGKVEGVSGDRVELDLGGAKDVWGFWDMESKQTIRVGAGDLVFGQARTIGPSMVALPTRETPPVSSYGASR
ncbi:MAG: DUF4396 domain-containing protein [Desulfobacteraceae bacterium]|nr:MAG: DUF4396 domain-containing protein [Desulfobacteraceae bacterium]